MGKPQMQRPSWLLGGGGEQRHSTAREVTRGVAQRGRAEGKSDKQIVNDAIKLLLKMASKHDMILAELCGAYYRTFKGEDQSPVMLAGTQAGKMYFKMVEEKGHEHGCGPAYLQIFTAILELLIVEGQQKIARHHFMVLQEYWTEVVMTTPVLDMADTVRMCRLKSLHRNKDGTEMKKIDFRFESIDLDKAFRAGLRSFGLSELTGAPPKGEMAKAIQRFLDTEFFR
jgi:hypothetical protein